MTETVADRLREAAGQVRQGHARGYLRDEAGNVCAIGAICRVQVADLEGEVVDYLDADPLATEAVLTVRDFLPTIGVDYAGDMLYWFGLVPLWNDRMAKDGEEVATVLEKAAAWSEERV